jgi:hypothetical protein
MKTYDEYYLPDGTPVKFLGNQDVKHFGFFSEASNSKTFFGFRLSKVRTTPPQTQTLKHPRK